MSYRSIFLHLDDSDAWERSIEFGASVAKSFGAELAGCYLVPRAHGHALHLGAASRRGGAGKPRRERVRAGPGRGALPRRGRDARAVLGELRRARGRRDRAGGAACAPYRPRHRAPAAYRQRRALPSRASSRMRCCSPPDGRSSSSPRPDAFSTLGSTVLIAWKETREAARAIADALPFLARARKVIVVAVASATPAMPTTWPMRCRAAAWLATSRAMAWRPRCGARGRRTSMRPISCSRVPRTWMPISS